MTSGALEPGEVVSFPRGERRRPPGDQPQRGGGAGPADQRDERPGGRGRDPESGQAECPRHARPADRGEGHAPRSSTSAMRCRLLGGRGPASAMSTGTVERIGVVGAGTMGAGIAQIAALGGYETRLHDPIPAALETGHRAAAPSRWPRARRRGCGASRGRRAGERPRRRRAQPRRPRRMRPGGRGGARGPGAEATSCSPALADGLRAGDDPRQQHLLAAGHRDRGRGAQPRARRRHALLQPAGADEAGRGGRHRRLAPRRRSRRPPRSAARMGRTPIRAKDSPGFIANRLARPFTLESLRMLADGVADAETIDRVCRLGGGFRMGPFELIDLIGLDVNLSVARSFYAQGGEPERWRPSAIQETAGRRRPCSAARAAGASTIVRRRAPPRARSRPRHRAPRPSTRRSWRRSTPRPPRSSPACSPRSPTRRPSRSKRRSARRRHGHGDAARLQLAARPARVHRADRRRRAPSSCSKSCSASTARPTGPRRGCSPRRSERSERLRKPASERIAAQNRDALTALPSADEDDFEEARRGLVAPFEPARGRDRRRPRGLGARVLRLPRRPSRPRPPTRASGARASSAASPASSSWRRASTSCAASTSRTCTWSRATRGSS